MSEKTAMKYLEDIRNYSKKALDYTDNMTFDEFINDDKTIDATIRAIEVVGEAASKIKKLPNSEEFFKKYDNVDWKDAIEMRNRVIHGYEDVDYEIIWNTVKADFLELNSAIEEVINDFGKKP